MTVVNILEPIQISCLIVGAMMPYAFSALTMSSVGKAAEQMVIQPLTI
jgi:Na+/H+-translocating membrane pyrophosphatase